MRTTGSLATFMLVLMGICAHGQPSENAPDAQGKYVFRKANCMGCHKWDGNGGGGYGGAALSLRRTQLSSDQIIMTVECGRPGTGMPYHLRGAYDDPNKPCYGIDRQQAGAQMPPEPAAFLRADDIKSVVAYVIDGIKGRGEVTYTECMAFWGEGSRVCDIYRNGGQVGSRPGG
jgi:hypothetical protein